MISVEQLKAKLQRALDALADAPDDAMIFVAPDDGEPLNLLEDLEIEVVDATDEVEAYVQVNISSYYSD